jgi:hypothetical protein
MEPGYMIAGHASGMAAAIAAKTDSSVQSIDRKRLRTLLHDQGQIVRIDK